MKTTLHTVLCVAIRLGAVLMAVGIFEQILGVALYPTQDGHLVWVALSVYGAGLLLAFALWLWPNLLAWWAIGRNQLEVLEMAISAGQLQYLVLSVLGVWTSISGFSGLVGHGAMILFIKQAATVGDASGMVPTGEWHSMVYYGTMLLAGTALTLGARGLVGVLQRLRGYPQATTATGDNADFAQDG